MSCEEQGERGEELERLQPERDAHQDARVREDADETQRGAGRHPHDGDGKALGEIRTASLQTSENDHDFEFAGSSVFLSIESSEYYR